MLDDFKLHSRKGSPVQFVSGGYRLRRMLNICHSSRSLFMQLCLTKKFFDVKIENFA